MVRSYARAYALFVMVYGGLAFLNTTPANAQGDDPFGSPAKKSPPDDNPFSDGTHQQSDAPKAPAAQGPYPANPYSDEGKVAILKKPQAPRLEKPASSNERVRAALLEPTRMEFIDTPLQDAVNFLKDYHQIEIQLDDRALQDSGVDSDTPVSRNLSRLPLKSALRIVLADLDLAYVVKNDVLLITSRAKASEMCEVQVYDVTKVVAPDVKADEMVQMLTMLLSESVQRTIGGEITSSGLQRIRIVPMREMLVILASQEEHEEIAKILQGLSKSLAERPK